MIGKWLNYMSRLHDGVDAILIADRHGIIEYSAMFSEQENGLIDEGFIGRSILEVYPELTEETSSHFRVMRTGEPILNEKQVLTDFRGRRVMLVTSTFPLEDNGAVIGTMETSVFYHKDSQLDGKNHWLTNPHKGLFRLEDIVTRNPEMLSLKDTVERVAANSSPVLIWGETGTGKELFAQSLHSHSTRVKGPFISQNCAAIPTTLLESTLFGTVRGSYTGAENRKGLLKQADGGTLFLDEVNSMDLALQAKILKAIEEKKFRPVGGEQDVHSDVRIVSAMNVDPVTAVRDGLLRRDLFYRLGVVQLALPPLRKRPEDIPLLTDFYVEQYNRKMDRIERIRNFQSANRLEIEYSLTSVPQDWPHIHPGDSITLEYVISNRNPYAVDLLHPELPLELKAVFTEHRRLALQSGVCTRSATLLPPATEEAPAKISGTFSFTVPEMNLRKNVRLGLVLDNGRCAPLLSTQTKAKYHDNR